MERGLELLAQEERMAEGEVGRTLFLRCLGAREWGLETGGAFGCLALRLRRLYSFCPWRRWMMGLVERVILDE